MVLFIIGLGLGDEKDITVKGLEAVKRCSRVYLEHYTAILCASREKLEEYYGKKVLLADREMVESNAQEIMKGADVEDVALLVVGDPLAATTHSDFIIRAHERKIPVQVIHNASIMNACAACGLQLYNFGRTVSIPYAGGESFYDYIKANQTVKLHTLCLLDIRVKEQTTENILKGNKIYEPPRFMSVNEAIAQLLAVEAKRQEKVISSDMMAIGLARVGQSDQIVASGTLKELSTFEFGAPLHSLVIAGETHAVEREMLAFLSVRKLISRGQDGAEEKGTDQHSPEQQSYVYKVEDADVWAEAQKTDQYKGTALDIQDGFVHLSSAHQVAGVLERYFAGNKNLVLIQLRKGEFGPELKYEVNPHGCFPHLYSALPVRGRFIVRVAKLALDDNGRHVIPPDMLLQD